MSSALAALAPSNALLKVVPFSIAIDMCCPRHGPPSTARVAEDPLRASPAPLGDAGLPPPPDRSVLLRLAGAHFARHRPPFPTMLRVHTTADAPDGASGNVLRTYALSAFSNDRHSIAIAGGVDPVEPVVPSRLFSPASLAPPVAVAPSALRPPTTSTSHMPRRLQRHRCTHAVRLAALVVGTPLRICVARAGSARHRLPHPAILAFRTTADATARASGRVLRTPALSSVGSHSHSVAVAAPFRRLRQRRSPFAHTPGFPFLTAWRGLWCSHPTHP